MQCNDYYSIVNQVSSALFDNKLVRKSLHNETNFNNILDNGRENEIRLQLYQSFK